MHISSTACPARHLDIELLNDGTHSSALLSLCKQLQQLHKHLIKCLLNNAIRTANAFWYVSISMLK